MFFSYKTVGYLQVIHQPLYCPKQIRAGEYAVSRKIGLERAKGILAGRFNLYCHIANIHL
jgi:hypothetical protein